MAEVIMSEGQTQYFKALQDGVDETYAIANRCRKQGFDGRNFVEIPQAEDMASRVQQLLSFLNERQTAEQLRTLNVKYEGNRELVAIEIAKIVCWESIVEEYDLELADLEQAFERLKGTKTDMEIGVAIYQGVCAGLAVITEGILVAPLEGVVDCHIIKNANGTKALAINYAGPIRSAGGTGQALSVLLADYLRRDFKLGRPQLTEPEIDRYIEEVLLYHNLQYKPSAAEMRSICQEVPVYITGEGVGKEVSGGRDLPRVGTNNVREGMLLVMCEGMLQKAAKLKKYTDQLNLDGWDFLDAYCATRQKESQEVVFKPKDTYISDAVAGRPTISQPMAKGGFRLRYGRTRGAGLAGTAISPASMIATGGFIVAATQMKIERPGKATVVAPCDSIDGPYIQFTNGSAQRFNDATDLKKELGGENLLDCSSVVQIWDIGEILIPFGEFRENNHPLMASPYVPEWHLRVVERHGLLYPQTFEEALTQATENKIPIAPDYTAHFSDVSAEALKTLMENISIDVCTQSATVTEPTCIDTVYELAINIDENAALYGDSASVLLNNTLAGAKFQGSMQQFQNGLEFVNHLANYEIKPRVTYRIGSRMAKPEKVAQREMKPPIHGLIPVGHDLKSRSVKEVALKGKKAIQIGWRFCPSCLKQTIDPKRIREEIEEGRRTRPKEFTTAAFCRKCEIPTEFAYTPSYRTPPSEWPVLDYGQLWAEAYTRTTYGDSGIKGVKGLTSKEKIPENMVKGMLRHKNGVSTFRDGTVRFDMVDMTLTHFKPEEIGLSVEKAHELGYVEDYQGAPLERPDQICELRAQDFVAPTQLQDKLFQTANFVDELLVRLYEEEEFYQLSEPTDLIGHLFATLAPHTSGAILCRLIGFCDIKGGYFHPYSIAGRRRNSDGDIDSIILLLDCILNFSRTFLSTFRGGQMDAPLILTTRINPAEIDKEALNIDTAFHYSEEAYQQTQKSMNPKDIASAFAEDYLGTENQFEGFGFTHDTADIGETPKENPYTALKSMREKVDAQFKLGALLRGVDNEDQSSRLLDRHLLRDMRGNIRAFGQQKVRCVKCNHSYRRAPLSKKCRQIIRTEKASLCRDCGCYNLPNERTNQIPSKCSMCDNSLEVDIRCDGKIILTVYPNSVMKYNKLMEHLIENFGCSEYNRQKYYQFKEWTQDMFGLRNKGTQQTLDAFMPPE
jgi:DNA polymerase II large subunit